mmetsp:Transcript_1324/g.4596  ORF Transcript_1324/g.4596 Transcript_1324/m.4596 type:complete len:88 (-) Transcript_1324:336-599(-)
MQCSCAVLVALLRSHVWGLRRFAATQPHSGIFVFLDGATGERKPMKTQDGEAPDIGNRVSVTGWVAEYYSYTELIHPRNTTVSGIIV